MKLSFDDYVDSLKGTSMELERFTYAWETAKRAWETALAQQAQPDDGMREAMIDVLESTPYNSIEFRPGMRYTPDIILAAMRHRKQAQPETDEDNDALDDLVNQAYSEGVNPLDRIDRIVAEVRTWARDRMAQQAQPPCVCGLPYDSPKHYGTPNDPAPAGNHDYEPAVQPQVVKALTYCNVRHDAYTTCSDCKPTLKLGTLLYIYGTTYIVHTIAWGAIDTRNIVGVALVDQRCGNRTQGMWMDVGAAIEAMHQYNARNSQ